MPSPLNPRPEEAAMRKNGFTLIELVVTVGIIAILAAIAIPAYSSYTKKANRTDATRTMTLDAQALERCYSQKFNYTDASCPATGSQPSTQGYYTVTIAVTTAPTASYTITAVPRISPQTSDTDCAQFTLNSAGTQGATTSSSGPNTQACWGST
jgi:type IV pilus assembly protein PilE